MMARNFNARLMILVYGFLLWLTTFIVSVVINPLKEASAAARARAIKKDRLT